MFKSSSQHVILNLLWGFSDAKSLSLFRTKRRISSLRSNDTDNSSLIAQIYCASKAFGNEERRQETVTESSAYACNAHEINKINRLKCLTEKINCRYIIIPLYCLLKTIQRYYFFVIYTIPKNDDFGKEILFLVLADVLHHEEEEPVGRMFQERRSEPIQETRGVRFLILKEFLQGTFDKFLRRDGYRQVHR